MLQRLNKRQLEYLAKYIDDQASTLPFKSFGALLQEMGFGIKRQQNLYLNEKERTDLANLFKRQVGEPKAILNNNDRANRIDTQKDILFEKHGNQAVAKNDIRMFSFSGVYACNGREYSLPTNGNLVLQGDTIKSIEHEIVVVCENLTTFINLYQFKSLLPASMTDALFIYRGQASSIQSVYQLLIKLNNRVVAMTDLDLAGIVISSTIPNVSAWLFPNIDKIKDMKKYNAQSLLWDNQIQFSASAKQYCEDHNMPFYLLLENEQAGLTQEAMFAHRLNLETFEI